MRRRSKVIAWVGLLALSACLDGEDVAQTVVWIAAEPAARTALARVTVQAVGPADNRETTVEAVAPMWPIKLVLAPKNGDASRRFTLHIDGYGAGDERLVSVRFETGFVPYQTRSAMLVIHDACVLRASEDCAGDSSCNVYDLDLEANKLGFGPQVPRKLDVTCDAGQASDPPDSTGRDGDAGSIATMGAAGSAGGVAGRGGDGGSNSPGGTAGATGSSPDGSSVPGPLGCDAGFMLEGAACIDIDECTNGDPCGERGQCQNAPGTYNCQCELGYAYVGGMCQDVDECQTNKGGCEGSCKNLEGGLSCSCSVDQGELKADRRGCGSFGAAERITAVPSTIPCQPRFAFDGEGNGLAVWTQSDGTRATLWTRRYRAGEGWVGVASRLAGAAAGDAGYPRLALDAQGRGAVVWVQTTDSHSDIWAVRYADQTFDTPAKLEQDDAGNAFLPSIALAADGDGFAVWNQSDGTHLRIWANRLSAAGWAEAGPIQRSDTDEAFNPELSVDPVGNASVAWTQSISTTNADMTTSTRAYPWSMRFSAASERWGIPVLLDDSGAAALPDTDLFEDANGVVVWTRYTEGRTSVVARSTGASSVIELTGAAADTAVAWPRLSLAPSGSGAAIWAQGPASAIQVWANRFDGSGWGEPALLSSTDSTSAIFPQIAIDPSGDGFAVWPEQVGTTRVIYARHLQSDVGWLAGQPLGSDVTADPPVNSPVRVEVDSQGNALAIWDVLDDGQYYVSASAFQ